MKKQILILLFSFFIFHSFAQQKNERVFENNNYLLLNSGEQIPIYKREVFIGGKGFQTRIQYYFSKDSVSAIFPLTIQNLKTVFADNVSFCEWLDIYFRSDSELLRYDNFKKMYFLNKVYLISKNNPIKTN
jgi:hypothetical protein